MNKVTKVKVVESLTGGARTPNKLKLGTQRLLKVLWEKHGGPRHLERVSGIAAQKFIHWRNKGYVSLKCAGKLGRSLDIPVEALNYEGVGELFGGNLYKWQQLLTLVQLTDDEKEYVLKGSTPKVFKR